MIVALRALALVVLVAPLTATAQSSVTSPRPGGPGPDLPPHVREQLWPERALSPVEAELKQHVVVLTDSLRRIDAIKAQIDRQTRAGTNAGIVRSSARTLASDCARGNRTMGPVQNFAGGLTTSDPKWGDPAVRDWRNGLAALTRALTTCEQAATALIDKATAEDSERLQAVSERASQALVAYRRTEQGLLNTLKISIDPAKRDR